MKAAPASGFAARRLLGCGGGLFVVLALALRGVGAGEASLAERDRDLLKKARMFLQTGRRDRGVEAYESLILRYPDAAFLHRELGHVFESQQEWDRAIAELRAAHLAEPLNDRIYFEYGQMLLWGKRPEKAVPVFEEILRREPTFLGAEEELLEACLESRKWKKAIPIVRKGLAEDPGDLRKRRQLADLYNWNGQWGKAIEEYDRLLAAEPGNRDVMRERAFAAAYANRWAGAEEGLKGILESDPGDEEARKMLADVYYYQDSYRRARQLYANMGTTNPKIQRQIDSRIGEIERHLAPNLSYSFFYYKERNRDTGEKDTTISHMVEFGYPWSKGLQLFADAGLRQDDVVNGATPIFGGGFQCDLGSRMSYEMRALFEPDRGENPALTFPMTLYWVPLKDFELALTEQPTGYWDSNFSNSAGLQGTWHLRKYVKGLRIRYGVFHDMIRRPSDYFVRIKDRGRPLQLFTQRATIEKDFLLPWAVLATGGYTYAWNSDDIQFHTGFCRLSRAVTEDVSLFGSFSYGVDTDDWEYLTAGAYGGITLRF